MARCRICACCFAVGESCFSTASAKPAEFQMSVGVTRSIENMFEPWTPRNAVGVEPVALDLHHAAIQFCGDFGFDGA